MLDGNCRFCSRFLFSIVVSLSISTGQITSARRLNRQTNGLIYSPLVLIVSPLIMDDYIQRAFLHPYPHELYHLAHAFYSAGIWADGHMFISTVYDYL